MKKPLIIIAGPTACGKTDTAIKLAGKIGGEIISADSMQVYKSMDIGTAKPTLEEMGGIPHYMIDELKPDEEFNVKIFQEKAKTYMEKIYSRNKIPILVGGTGFYINALVYDNCFMLTNDDDSIRNNLYTEASVKGNKYLYEKLLKIDPDYANMTHENNTKRVIRALEYYEQTGNRLSEHNKQSKQKESPYDVKFIILNMDRDKLYDRINLRVDLMMERGLLDEVKNLLDEGYSKELVSMQGLGYKEFMPFFNGEISLEDAVDTLKKKTRNFAKRQLTWFRNQNKDALWIDLTEKTKENATQEIIGYINDNHSKE